MISRLRFSIAAAALVLIGCNGPMPARVLVRPDSTIFMATVRALRDSSGPSVQFASEPLIDGESPWMDRTLRARTMGWRERWLRSAGIEPMNQTFEPCYGIFVLGTDHKQGCPQSQITIAKLSTVEKHGLFRVVRVSLRTVAPAGSSEEEGSYVFAVRRREWTLIARERGAVIE